MGGGTCMGFTMAYPERVRGLVMADTTGTMSESRLDDLRREFRESQPQPFTLQGRAYAPDLREAPAYGLPLQLDHGAEPRAAAKPPASATPPGGDRGEAGGAKGAGAVHRRREGRHHPALGPEARVDACPGRALRRSRRLRPQRLLEEPAAFNRIVSDFFDAVEKVGPKSAMTRTPPEGAVVPGVRLLLLQALAAVASSALFLLLLVDQGMGHCA